MEKPPMTIKQIAQLIENIASPKKGERVLFIIDYSPSPTASEKGRLELALRWHNAALELAKIKQFKLLPLVMYEMRAKGNAELPPKAVTHDGGHVDNLSEFIASVNVVIAMTGVSASAPLKNIVNGASHWRAAPERSIARGAPALRVVSMPGVSVDMEGVMSADYRKISERGKRLLAVVQKAVGFECVFDGAGVPRGTRLYIDTRAGGWILDDGACHFAGDFINFPSGELFTAPYEGVGAEGRSIYGDSKTQGVWPVYSSIDNKVAFLKVEKNRIVRVQGDSEEARKIVEHIASDENAANVAEIGFGINESARSGENIPVLEKEKAGPHIAYGRNDHFGSASSLSGKVKADVHIDFVYTRETPITVTIHAVYESGNRMLVAERGKVVAV